MVRVRSFRAEDAGQVGIVIADTFGDFNLDHDGPSPLSTRQRGDLGEGLTQPTSIPYSIVKQRQWCVSQMTG
jgi:hypothetical protein